MKSIIPGHEDVERIEQKLFESLRRDEPPARARRATAAALGLGTATLTSATAGAQGAAAIAKAGPLLVKWIGLGTLATAISVGSVSAVRYASEPPPAVSSRAVATITSALPTAKAQSAVPKTVALERPAPQATVPPTLPTQAPPSLPSREARMAERSSESVSEASPPPASVPAAVVHSRQLAAEVAMLDQARSAIASMDAERALDLLARYTR
ncbi:MAG TPA: hypothetical protein VGY54_24570, partial [Polyangiaceae bacterium]|nr:hypothetical protein [Polyangiaceae bacterium]